MSWSTDLSPTTLFTLGDMTAVTARMSTGYQQAWGGVPGVVRLGGYQWVGIPGTNPAARIEAYFRNIKVKSVHTAV